MIKYYNIINEILPRVSYPRYTLASPLTVMLADCGAHNKKTVKKTVIKKQSADHSPLTVVHTHTHTHTHTHIVMYIYIHT